MAKRSKKDVEHVVSGAGMFLEFIIALVAAFKKVGGTMDQFYCLTTPEGREVLERIARFMVGAVSTATYKVADCFRAHYIVYCDALFSKRLPDTLPSTFGQLIHREVVSDQTYRQMAEMILGVSGRTDEELARMLVERGMVCSLQRIDVALARYESGDKSDDLLDDGRLNIFFVLVGAGSDFSLCPYPTMKNGILMTIVHFHNDRRGWSVSANSFGYGLAQNAGSRVFFLDSTS